MHVHLLIWIYRCRPKTTTWWCDSGSHPSTTEAELSGFRGLMKPRGACVQQWQFSSDASRNAFRPDSRYSLRFCDNSCLDRLPLLAPLESCIRPRCDAPRKSLRPPIVSTAQISVFAPFVLCRSGYRNLGSSISFSNFNPEIKTKPTQLRGLNGE